MQIKSNPYYANKEPNSISDIQRMGKNSFVILGVVSSFTILLICASSAPYSSGFGGTNLSKSALTGCTTTWSANGMTLKVGQIVDIGPSLTITFTATPTTGGSCAGSGFFVFVPLPISGKPTIQSFGTCPSTGCTITVYSNSNLAPGKYLFVALFFGTTGITGISSPLAVNEFVVTPEFPAGIILAVLAPIVALFGYAKLRRTPIK